MQISLGGLVAEQLFFGEISSGPSGDLAEATTLVAQMIGSLGMAGSLFSYEALATPAGNMVTKVASTDEGKARIEAALDTARDEVEAMLAEHRGVVEALRDALLERHELIGGEILEVIRASTMRSSVASDEEEMRSSSAAPVTTPQPTTTTSHRLTSIP